MTLPRQVIAGRTQFISRRTTQRHLFLRPDDTVEQIYEYCLGEAATRYEVTLHGWIAMSNHQHVLLRDNKGNFPEFLAHLNKMIAKAMNARLGRWENFWAAEQPNAVYLVQDCDRFAKLVYLLVNPVAADLVEHAVHWPGASSFRLNLSGQPKVVARPRGFFREDGPMPDAVTLVAERLDGFGALTPDAWAKLLCDAVRAAEDEARARRMQTNTRVLGRKAVLRANPTDQPTTSTPRRALRPHLACLNRARRALELHALRVFRVRYRDAFHLWSAGDATVEFPLGTYRMLLFHVRCAVTATTSSTAS